MRTTAAWIIATTLLMAAPALASPPVAGRRQAAARHALLHFGCTSVVDIQRNADGSWTGQCTKGGSIIPVAIGPAGRVSSPQA